MMVSTMSLGVEPLLVQQSSPSGQYIVVQRPADTNYFRGYQTLLVRKIELSEEVSAENIEILAKMSFVKNQDDGAVWKVTKREGQGFLINEGDEVFLFRWDKNLLSGRDFDYDIDKKVIIESLNWVEKVPEHYFEGDQKFLAKLGQDFKVYFEERPQVPEVDGDIQTVDVKIWDEKKGENRTVRFPKDFYKPVDKAAVAEKKKIRALRSIVAHTIKEKKQKAEFSEVQKKYPQIDFGNPRWSEKYSDVEMAEILDEVGREQERLERLRILEQKYWYQLHFGASFGLLNKQSASDEVNRLDEQPALNFAIEHFTFKRIYLLKKFTTEFGITVHNSVLSNNGKNIESKETQYRLMVNYYPKFHYFDLQKVSMIYQVGMLFGQASLNSPSNGESGSYRVDAFPVFSIGAKYHFTRTFGIRGFARYVKKSYISREADWKNNSALRNNISSKDIIIAGSLGYMF